MTAERYTKETVFTIQRFSIERAIQHLPELEALALIRALRYDDAFSTLAEAKEIYAGIRQREYGDNETSKRKK